MIGLEKRQQQRHQQEYMQGNKESMRELEMEQRQQPIDYSKWDHIHCSSSEGDDLNDRLRDPQR